MNLIINCGTGNFSSVAKMINAAGGKSFFGSTSQDIDKASKIILPGVGSFDNGMKAIELASIKEKIIEKVKFENVPILGICIGMHLLCRSSEEGSLNGLNLVEAEVKKFYFPNNDKIKIPHMGWNIVKPVNKNSLISSHKKEQRFYFAHSYKVVVDNPNLTIGTSYYGSDFCAAFQKKNIFGLKFNPEKSNSFGLEIIKSFIKL